MDRWRRRILCAATSVTAALTITSTITTDRTTMEALATLLTVPAIVALVTILRDLGLPSKLAPVAAVVLGVGIGIVGQQLGHIPVVQAGADGLLVALAAAGVYDVAKTSRSHIEVAVEAPRRAIED